MSSYQVDVLCLVPVKITKAQHGCNMRFHQPTSIFWALVYYSSKVVVHVKIDICNCKEELVGHIFICLGIRII